MTRGHRGISRTEQTAAADAFQCPLVPRSRFQRRLMPSPARHSGNNHESCNVVTLVGWAAQAQEDLMQGEGLRSVSPIHRCDGAAGTGGEAAASAVLTR